LSTPNLAKLTLYWTSFDPGTQTFMYSLVSYIEGLDFEELALHFVQRWVTLSFQKCDGRTHVCDCVFPFKSVFYNLYDIRVWNCSSIYQSIAWSTQNKIVRRKHFVFLFFLQSICIWNIDISIYRFGFGLWCLTPLSAIF
jgi:hypothetical protein